MDSSEKYIIMCEQAKEIQKEATFDSLDLFYIFESEDEIYHPINTIVYIDMPIWYCTDDVGQVDKSYFLVHKRSDGSEYWYYKRYAWLPRQDDLQNLLTKEQLIKLGRLTFIHDNNIIHVRTMYWSQNDDIAYLGKSQIGYFTEDTMEKLWLQIVMKEKYNKLWDEKKQEWRDNVAEKTWL